jgi:hypothetical protein
MKENTLNNEIQIAVFEEKIERVNRWIEMAKENNEPKEFILQLQDVIVAFTERINELKNQ